MAQGAATPRRAGFGFILCAALLTACDEPPHSPTAEPRVEETAAVQEPPAAKSLVPGLELTPAVISDIPGFQSDSLAEALPALRRSCDRFAALPDERGIGPQGLAGTAADWREVCAKLGTLTPDDDEALRDLLQSEFVAFMAGDGASRQGLFTGYYESELTGSLTPSGPNAVPLYSLPDDIVEADLGAFKGEPNGKKVLGRLEEGRFLPYYSRAEIDAGALDGRGLELIWADDPVDAFFLHVQGSGQVRLPDGNSLRVGFAGSNGHPFYAIGRHLLDQKIISREEASMQTIRDWLRAHPEEGKKVMALNKRFIFFKPITGEGPIGAQGVALTPRRSLAVDTAYIPLGVPVFLDTTWPGSGEPLQRLMVAQDTGSAIKGAVRGDFFWGSGEAALVHAGGMKQPGSYYIFLPRSVAERILANS